MYHPTEHSEWQNLNFFYLDFSYYFMFFTFREEGDIKKNKNTYLASFLIEVGNGTLTKLTSGG